MEIRPDRLLICCEGETEKEYLSALADKLEVMSRLAIRKTAACSPIALLEEAYKEYMWSNATDKQFPFTEVWCVFDRDHHPSYDTVFEIAKTLGIPTHLCWTNPCIEFWFWLHYCGDKNHLKFDEFTEVGRTQERVVVSTDEFEDRLVRRMRRSIKPETMLALLKEKCAGYSKAKCPPGIINRTLAACDNLKAVAQSEDPHALGSAMPALLLRLSNLAETVHGKKTGKAVTPAPAAVSAETVIQPAPVVTVTANAEMKAEETVALVETPETDKTPAPVEEVASLSQKESNSVDTLKTKVNRWIAHAVPSDPVEPLKKQLRQCLTEWLDIHVNKDQLISPEDALKRLCDFFQAVSQSATDLKTREKGKQGLYCIQNLLKYMADVPMSQNRGKRIVGRLNAAGSLLNIFALDWGMASVVKGMTFSKCCENDDGGELSMSSAVVPVDMPSLVEEETIVKDPETLREEQLVRYLKALQELQERFQAAMDCILVLPENGKPSELIRGVCDKAGTLEEQALFLIVACTELANKVSIENPVKN